MFKCCCFFVWGCVCAPQSLEKLGHYCKELQESNLHAAPLSFTLSCALEAKKTGSAYFHLPSHYYVHTDVSLFTVSIHASPMCVW